MNNSKGSKKKTLNNNYGDFEFVDNRETLGKMKHPKSILTFEKPHPSVSIHPTQKSVALYEWLIKTYSYKNEIILDNCMGSGTAAIACININRNYIGFELDKGYFDSANTRIHNHKTKISTHRKKEKGLIN